MFHVGQLVECVNDDPLLDPHGNGKMDGLRRGVVYTIREHFFDFRYGLEVVRLYELHRPKPYPEVSDWPYDSRRFRPLTDSRIAVFRKMLAPSPKQTEPA